MGPRPDDFNEELIRNAPTFKKWLKLEPGQSLSYACRKFVKGGVNDEERLMRRIMIARRNNLKDHAVLKKARAAEAEKRGTLPGERCGGKEKTNHSGDDVKGGSITLGDVGDSGDSELDMPRTAPPSPSNPSGTKRRRVAGMNPPSDDQILMEMDVPAVEATRSYRKWLALPNGVLFTYNQSYVKGKDDHDWLLKKNIWRRMRYRRENQYKVEKMGMGRRSESGDWDSWKAEDMLPTIAPPPTADQRKDEDALVSRAVADAAAAAAAQVEAFEPGIDAVAVAALGAEDPIVSSALAAAAQLAAAAVGEDTLHVRLEDDVTEGADFEGNADAVNVQLAAAAGDELIADAPVKAELEEHASGEDKVEMMEVTVSV